ncbi:MAG TPA: hypothetical protein VGN72_07550 [Tepidisphaeraceae bacterium]|jgi:hypothetical protein|nr:hypothetical protein [Tepidisphaeraceae bacterium]
MANGDRLLDASGNVILDDSGNVILSDGNGDDCCCGGPCNNLPKSWTGVTITRSGTVATITFPEPHLFNPSFPPNFTVSGATPSGYNFTNGSGTVASATTVTYSVSNTLTTPATGTITVSLRTTAVTGCGSSPDFIEVEFSGIVNNCGCVKRNGSFGDYFYARWSGNPNNRFCLRRFNASAWTNPHTDLVRGHQTTVYAGQPDPGGCTDAEVEVPVTVILNRNLSSGFWSLAMRLDNIPVPGYSRLSLFDAMIATASFDCLGSYSGVNSNVCPTGDPFEAVTTIATGGTATVTPYVEVGI